MNCSDAVYKGICQLFHVMERFLSGNEERDSWVEGHYVPFGVFSLYNDSCLNDVLSLFLQLVIRTPFNQLNVALFAIVDRMLEISKDDPHIAWTEIREGKFHQVKRMFSACGKTVTALHRESIGALTLDPTLTPGEAKILDPSAAALVFEKPAQII